MSIFGKAGFALALTALPVPALAERHLAFAVGEGPFSWDAYEDWAAGAPDLTGQTLVISGPWLYPEYDVFRVATEYFSMATGASVIYSGSDSFETQILTDAASDTPPHIAVFPQPGLAAVMASQGLLHPLDPGSRDWVEENYSAGSSWVDLGTYPDENGEDQFFGFFYNINLKSLVWYAPQAFADAGYTVPDTMEELLALSEQMVADGRTPWCIGLGSGAATGWPATDWVEDLMLRSHSPEVYDQWVRNEIPFDDPRVIEAIETFGSIAKTPDMTMGGPAGTISTDFRESPAGLFSDPPGCFMHRQASFIATYFPDGVGQSDADFFYFPSFGEKDLGNPVLGGGTVLSIVEPSTAASAFMEYLRQPLAHEVMMAQRGFLTPHQGVNLDAYANEILRGQGEILLGATTFRFDGSDLMPGDIGAGAFWTGMVDYVDGEDASVVTRRIQAVWDELK